MAQGSVVKCMAVYERPFWRERGLSGAVTSVTGPVSVGFDNSPPDGSPGVLLGFLEGRAAREAMDLSRDERRRIVAECFGRFFGPEAADPIDYVDKAWGADEWSRGCYGGFMPPGAWSDHGAALRAADRPDPLGRGGDGDGLERLHGRRGRLGPGRRAALWTPRSVSADRLPNRTTPTRTAPRSGTIATPTQTAAGGAER